jgi:hypothetical protein
MMATRDRIAMAAAVMVLTSGAVARAAHLVSSTVDAWNTYVSATEARRARELKSPRGFLALDFAGGATSARHAVLSGDVVVEHMQAAWPSGEPVEVPSALVHHWRGAILIPGMSAARLVAQLQDGAPPTRQEDVLQSTVLERRPDWMRMSLKLQRKKIVTVVFNTEHVVTFARDGASRATSASTATKIAEVTDAGTPQERELPIGDDRGFLWRLNAYWRYEDVPGGVIAECESITLSRDVPSVVRYFVMPLIERAARESMTRTLVALRTRFANGHSAHAM